MLLSRFGQPRTASASQFALIRFCIFRSCDHPFPDGFVVVNALILFLLAQRKTVKTDSLECFSTI